MKKTIILFAHGLSSPSSGKDTLGKNMVTWYVDCLFRDTQNTMLAKTQDTYFCLEKVNHESIPRESDT
jgi:hypothetical protein